MLRRSALILSAGLALALPASAAGQAFGPLPQSQQPQPVQTQPVQPRNTTSDDNVSSQTTILLFVIMIVGLGGIVFYIRRDARAAAPVTDRQKSEDDIHGRAKSAARHKQERKRQARAKAKRQRAARKKQR